MSGVVRTTAIATHGAGIVPNNRARKTVPDAVTGLRDRLHLGSTRQGGSLRVGTAHAGQGRGKGVQVSSAQTQPAELNKKSDSDLLNEQLLEENAYLRAENGALRNALAETQQCSPAEVAFEFKYATNVPDASPSGGAGSTAAAPVKLPKGADLETQLQKGIKWPTAGEREFWDRPAREQALLVGGMETRAATKDQRQLHVVHVTAEMAPCAKVGGLGDVVTGLSRAALQRGHNVEVMLPFYECISGEEHVEGLEFDQEFDCPKGMFWDGSLQQGSLKTLVYRGKIDGVPVLLLRPDWDVSNIFKGSRIYGGSYNEMEAYLYFSRACLEYLRISGRQPHVLHCHEWQTAAVPMLYWDVFHNSGMQKPRVMLTVHNFDSLGECRQDEFAITGVPGEQFAEVEKALDERTIGHNPERLSLMKGGVVYSNAITTVSPTYATEALHGGAAGWLRSTLAKPAINAKFHGVLNGIDTDMWDPSNDPFLPATYSPAHMLGKQLCKRYLQQGLGLEVDPAKPLVACVTRLVPQKGIHLIRHSIGRTNELGGQYLLLGSGHADRDFRAMADGEYKDHPNVRLMIMYSERLAHLIYAAADMVLVPSMFEPCGLTQLIAMRYGAVPVVRATGGLADTVKDVDDAEQRQANGFTFTGFDEGSLNGALDRALAYYKDKPDWWAKLSKQNMQVDTSWNRSVEQYVQLYMDMADPY